MELDSPHLLWFQEKIHGNGIFFIKIASQKTEYYEAIRDDMHLEKKRR